MKLRVATERLRFVVVSEPRAKKDQRGAQRVDARTGAMLWELALVPIGDDVMSESITVTVDAEPKVAAGAFVEVRDLIATSWEIEGRSGISYRASQVVPSTAPGAGPVKQQPAA